MTPEQIALVKRTFVQINRQAQNAGESFYQHLFDLNPALRALFRGAMEAQARSLMLMMGLVANSLDLQQKIVPIVYDLGKRHAFYGVTEQDYDVFGEALLDTLAGVLGKDFDRETREAWGAAYGFLAHVMKQAQADVSGGRTLPYGNRVGMGEHADAED